MKISVALAEECRQGEVRFLGEIDNSPDAIRRLVSKLTGKFRELYEAGPTGYGLHRQITALGHACSVIAPSLIPKRPGEHVKTNRRDALTLARLHRAGELSTIWVPDSGHEAIRDLVRAREAAMEDLREKRQHPKSFEHQSPCEITGSPTASSNPTTISSTTAARHGTSSSISLGASCPSDCANGRTGSDQWDLVLVQRWPLRQRGEKERA
jgi:hypothetical protein